ncbi:AhpC-TSA-domain-containing protein [Lophiostoma macrostomum CBS 122681]|uniref:thioredoxin-dependent peroxiredoxin n=1 Tax=Lophiostoma macrostomum CBS 122681 TaxID=1314788 RepID=A0A6A6TAJ0_9PLEO|nr:AhpC-TSA-domain-containing protein [Lophiostoma macrostomum CBS 122681]
MVELRKRKTPPPAPVRPAKKQAAPKAEKPKASKVGKAKAVVAEKVEAVKETVTGKAQNGEKATPSAPAGAPKAGDTVDLAGFGGEFETHEGTKTSLAKLVEQSKSGVVLFTYPKASTPGCTKQACFFRDSYTPLTATGFDIYGLSNDSPKSNTTFKTKQNLPYPLLCDTSRTLLAAIGLQGAKSATRGVFVIDKEGKVLAAEPGSPDGTVEVVRRLVGNADGAGAADATTDTDADPAKTASEVADTAAKLDG